MPNFYPVNTPLINYFFYKAPFINNAYSLTNLSLVSGGSSYAVNDIVILAGGTYTNPAVIRVTAVNSGVITAFEITNNGKYTVTPTGFTQLSTNGSGIGATFNNLIFYANLIPPGPNVPLSGGFLYFYEDENRTVQANTYSDVSDPVNPTVNPNPLQLGASGEIPLFYLDDRLYYIVITDNTGDQSNPIDTIEHYNPSEVLSQNSAFNDNFIINPQFNYPITFYKTSDDVGEITQPNTVIAWAWEFLEDEKTTSENYITYENISGQSIEGNPIFQVVLTCEDVSSSETLKDFRSYLGEVDFYEGSNLTFSAQMVSKRGLPVNVILYLERFYGANGSPTELITLGTITVGISREKFILSFSVPQITGKIIGEGNYLALRIQPGIQSICTFGMTNVMVLPGDQVSPVFVDEPYGFSKAQILGEATDINSAGLRQNWSSYYYNNGSIIPYADTGTIVLEPNNSIQTMREKCDGSARLVNSYSPYNIPYRRLFNVIGNTFGGTGTLVAESSENVVTVSSNIGAREKSPWTVGTTTGLTIVKTMPGLSMGVNLVNNGDLTVSGTFVDQFSPDQSPAPFIGGPEAFLPDSPASVMTYWGSGQNVINSQNMIITTLTPGSGSSNATFEIEFDSSNVSEYQSRLVSYRGALNFPVQTAASFIEFASFGNNTRGGAGNNVNQLIIFSLDGVWYQPSSINSAGSYTVAYNNQTIVPLNSNLTIHQNINIFVSTVANPFIFTITVNSVSLASQYFLFSDETTDFVGYFTVNGVGTDPALPGRTSIPIPLFTGYTTTDEAKAIALALNTADFSLPSPSDLPTLVGGSKVSWFINL